MLVYCEFKGSSLGYPSVIIPDSISYIKAM